MDIWGVSIFWFVWTVLLYMSIHVFAWVSVFHSFEYIPRDRIAESHGVYVQLFEELPGCFPQWLHHFTFPLATSKCSNFSTSSPTLIIIFFLSFKIIAVIVSVKWYSFFVYQLIFFCLSPKCSILLLNTILFPQNMCQVNVTLMLVRGQPTEQSWLGKDQTQESS